MEHRRERFYGSDTITQLMVAAMAYMGISAFCERFRAILDSVGEVAGLVGRSMGTASALECKHVKLENKPLLLIALPYWII